MLHEKSANYCFQNFVIHKFLYSQGNKTFRYQKLWWSTACIHSKVKYIKGKEQTILAYPLPVSVPYFVFRGGFREDSGQACKFIDTNSRSFYY